MADKPDLKELESFKKTNLKKVQTKEKNTLPTKEEIEKEKKEAKTTKKWNTTPSSSSSSSSSVVDNVVIILKL